MLAVCEKNSCLEKYESAGNGTVLVLEYSDTFVKSWSVVTAIHLPSETADFDDYSGMDVRSDGTIAVVSQQSAKLWIGQLDFASWTIQPPGDESAGTTYDFPTVDGEVVFCNVEGVSFLDNDHIVVATDQNSQAPCRQYSERVATFTIPS